MAVVQVKGAEAGGGEGGDLFRSPAGVCLVGRGEDRQALQMIPGPLVERLCLGMTCPQDPAGDLLSLGKAKFVRGRV